MVRLGVLKRLEAAESATNGRETHNERRKAFKRFRDAVGSDPELAAHLETIGKQDMNRSLSERLNSRERIEAAKQLAGRLAEAGKLFRSEA